MIRIQETAKEDGTLTLVVEGRVIGRWVEELRRACERALSGGGKMALDLSGVWFIDHNGVALLRGLACRVPLEGCSRFVEEQLKGSER